MRLRPYQTLDRAQLEALKPKPGDTVHYHGEQYVVINVGLRFLHAYRKNDPKKLTVLLRMKDVVKGGLGANQ